MNFSTKVSKYFLNSPITISLGFFILLLGVVGMILTPKEEDPQIAMSGGSVIVAMPGASVKEIENIIIKPLQRKLTEIQGVDHIYSYAKENVGIVNVMYKIGQNRELSNLKLYDKVMQNMDKMPKTAMQPIIKPFDIDIDIPILSIAFFVPTSKISNIEFFEEIAYIRNKFNSYKNVAKTELKGEKKPQFNIKLDLYKLSAYHLSIGQIMQAVKSLSANSPNIDLKYKNELVVFGVSNAIKSVEDIQNIIVAKYNNSVVYLSDIASVELGEDIQNTQSALLVYKENDKIKQTNQITLTISKIKNTNAVNVSKNILKELKKIEPKLNKKGIKYIVTRDYGQRANEAVNSLVWNLIIATIIVALLLLLTMSWKEALIVTLSIPLIFSITLFVALMSDQSINRITLFALIVSLGILVDASIIVVENISRHLEMPYKDIDKTILDAISEISPPTNIATLGIIITIIPMAFVGEMMGQFMKPLPINVPITIFASLFVAYIFVPYLAKKLMSKKDTK